MSKQLTEHQEKLLSTVKAAHANLEVARRTKDRETARRIAEAKIQAQREWDRVEELIRIDVAASVNLHATALDEALIAAYNAGVPVRNIARDGFGNRHDSNVHVMLRKLREDARVGNVVGYQGREDESDERSIVFPDPINVEAILLEANEIQDPEITLLDEPFTLVEESAPGAGDNVEVRAAVIKLDARDPYFSMIRGNHRKGSPYMNATKATIYVHPGSGKLVAHESAEEGDMIWDHPVARFVKDHNDQVREEFDRLVAEADGDFTTSTI